MINSYKEFHIFYTQPSLTTKNIMNIGTYLSWYERITWWIIDAEILDGFWIISFAKVKMKQNN